MDRIIKLLVCCMALVSLVIFILPNSDPLAPAVPAAEGPAAAVPPPPAVAQIPQPQPVAESGGNQASGFTVEDYDISRFGEPMFDPTPPSQRESGQGQNNGGQVPAASGYAYPGQGYAVNGQQQQNAGDQHPSVPIPPPPVVRTD